MQEILRNEGQEKILILVKALPHVGRDSGELVCCAGLTLGGEWRRLFPIRFRQLNENKFNRWQWVSYRWRTPKADKRPESRRVYEETIQPGEYMRRTERTDFLTSVFVDSTTEAANNGQTLALVRPKNVNFYWKAKTDSEIEDEKREYARAADQGSFFDEELKALTPCPYEFRFKYNSGDGAHNQLCGDWETTAMFTNFQRLYGEQEALEKMSVTFNEDYPRRGMAFALGTHSRRPNTWLLVGVIRLDETHQIKLGL